MKAIYNKLEGFIFDLNPNEIEKVKTQCYTGFKV